MRLIQIGNRVVNLEQVTSAEYNPDESHPSYPARVYSELRINYSSGMCNYDVFYEAEADALWKIIQVNSTLNLRSGNLAAISAIASQDEEPTAIPG